MAVVALAVRFNERRSRVRADREPRIVQYSEYPLREHVAPVLRREDDVRVQAVDTVRADPETSRCCHARIVKR